MLGESSQQSSTALACAADLAAVLLSFHKTRSTLGFWRLYYRTLPSFTNCRKYGFQGATYPLLKVISLSVISGTFFS